MRKLLPLWCFSTGLLLFTGCSSVIDKPKACTGNCIVFTGTITDFGTKQTIFGSEVILNAIKPNNGGTENVGIVFTKSDGIYSIEINSDKYLDGTYDKFQLVVKKPDYTKEFTTDHQATFKLDTVKPGKTYVSNIELHPEAYIDLSIAFSKIHTGSSITVNTVWRGKQNTQVFQYDSSKVQTKRLTVTGGTLLKVDWRPSPCNGCIITRDSFVLSKTETKPIFINY